LPKEKKTEKERRLKRMVKRSEGPQEWVESLRKKAAGIGNREVPAQATAVEKPKYKTKGGAKRAQRIPVLDEHERRTLTRVVVDLYHRGRGAPPDPVRVRKVCMGKENIVVTEEQAAIEIASFMAARQKGGAVRLPYGVYDRSMRQTLIEHTLMAMCRREGLRAIAKGRAPAMASCEPQQRDIISSLAACGVKRSSKRTICRDLLEIAGPSMPYSRKVRSRCDSSPWGKAYAHLSFDEIKGLSGVFRRWRRCSVSKDGKSVFTATMYEFRKELYDLATDIGTWFLEQFGFFKLPAKKLKVLQRGWVPRVVQAAAGFVDNNNLLGPILWVLKKKWEGTDRLSRCLAFAKVGNDI
jgi:hypothetical protein